MPAAPCTSGSTIERGEARAVRARASRSRLGERGAERRLRVHAALPAEDVRRRQADRGQDGVGDEAMEGLRVADADRAERVAVVGLDQRREARAPRRRRAAAGTGARCGARPRPRSRRRRSRRRASSPAGDDLRRARAPARSAGRCRGRAASCGRRARAGRAAPRRASGGDGRARCTRATTRRRGSAGRACRSS